MNVTLKNIGTLKEATFDLDKDLIVFIGPNNTGKTYAAYCLYGLTRLPNLLTEDFIKSIFHTPFFIGDIAEVNLLNIFTKEKIKQIIAEYSSKLKSQLPLWFAVDKENLKQSEISFDNFCNPTSFERYFSDLVFSQTSYLWGNIVTFEKKSGSDIVVIKLTEKQTNINNIEDVPFTKEYLIFSIELQLIQIVFGISKMLTNGFFIPAERIGISAFSKDILINRFKNSNHILSRDTDRNDFTIFPLAISDAISNYEELLRYKSQQNLFLSNLENELEQKILRGKIVVKNDRDVFFQTNDFNLPIMASGSTIKSLAILILYLRYVANFNQILFIDEPEINLHPDNQRLIARILAKLSKLGVKVIVSTHSDYFIRELNNLIMLNKDHPETKALRDKYGYDETEILDHKKVGAYLFKDNKSTSLNVTEQGMEAATIDEEINKLNNTATDIYWTLFED